MSYYIKNETESDIKILGKIFASAEKYKVEEVEKINYVEETGFHDLIISGDIGIYVDDYILPLKTALAEVKKKYICGIAVDKDNIDQSLSGNDWTELTAVKAIWDLGSNYDLINNDFVIPFDGIFFFDLKLKLASVVNCTHIEVALFKREEIEDDYWFIIDKKKIDGDAEIILSGATMYDFYEDEKYCIKIKLYGENASANIIGCDDYTAWGFNFENSLYL